MPVYINGVLDPHAELNSWHGWGYYEDTQYLTGSRLTMLSAVRTLLPNNAGETINSYLPAGVTSFYNLSTSKFTPDTVGDSYMMRINFNAKSSTIDNFVNFELDIGGSQGVISSRVLTFPRGTNEHPFSTSTLIFTLGTFVTNGGEIFLTPDDDFDIWDIKYLITRVSTP